MCLVCAQCVLRCMYSVHSVCVQCTLRALHRCASLSALTPVSHPPPVCQLVSSSKQWDPPQSPGCCCYGDVHNYSFPGTPCYASHSKKAAVSWWLARDCQFPVSRWLAPTRAAHHALYSPYCTVQPLLAIHPSWDRH